MLKYTDALIESMLALGCCQPIFFRTESHKALLIDSLILCCVALWQDAEAPCGDFKCQL